MRYLSLILLALSIPALVVIRTGSADASRFPIQQQAPSPTPTPDLNRKHLEGYARSYGLSGLANTRFESEDYELRVWVGFSNTFPRALILSRKDGRQTSAYITGKLDAAQNPITQNDLKATHSDEYLKREIEVILARLLNESYSSDSGWGDPDAVSVGIEVRRGSVYRVLLFPISTKSRDGKRLMRYVFRLQNLYGIKLLGSGNRFH